MHRFFAGVAVVLCSLAFGQPVHEAVAILSYGKIRGNLHPKSMEFLGIPYAAPPERFAPPKPWEQDYPQGVHEAEKYAHMCVQHPFSKLWQSENCLYLNVYTARKNLSKVRLPVMLWIHGGHLSTGSAMLPIFNGTRLVEQQDVVVVAINYRLNVFGFTAVKDSNGEVLANAGFLDQREAMRWVRKNIHAFGGDANRVTLFGESAGAQSVFFHMVSPGSKGLFHGAIAESAPINLCQSLEKSLNDTAALSAKVQCSKDNLSCLRKTGAKKLIKASKGTQDEQCTYDGNVYPAPAVEMIRKGIFNDVPLIFGNNFDEGNFFFRKGGLLNSTVTDEQVQCVYEKTFGTALGQKLRQVQSFQTPGSDNINLIADAITLLVFACDNRRVARELVLAGLKNMWSYTFRRRSKSAGRIPGVYHSEEIPFVFNNMADLAMLFPGHFQKPFSVDLDLSARVGELWATFARDGEASTGWLRFQVPQERVLKIDLGTLSNLDMEEGYRRAECDVMEEVKAFREDLASLVNEFFTNFHECVKTQAQKETPSFFV